MYYMNLIIPLTRAFGLFSGFCLLWIQVMLSSILDLLLLETLTVTWCGFPLIKGLFQTTSDLIYWRSITHGLLELSFFLVFGWYLPWFLVDRKHIFQYEYQHTKPFVLNCNICSDWRSIFNCLLHRERMLAFN